VLPLLVIVGPTASGKTGLSLDIAERLGAEIISADSMQVYRRMDIGTAKIAPAARRGIPHHLLDIRNPDETINVAEYQELAEEKIRAICGRKRLPILVGGSGLYIQAVIDKYDFSDDESSGTHRQKLNELLETHGQEHLHQLLTQADPVSAEKIHANDTKRVRRALEYFCCTNKRISEKTSGYDRSVSSKYNMVMIGLTSERCRLYERINHRVETMLAEGFLAEVEALLQDGYSPDLPAMQGLGYKQLAGFLEGRTAYPAAVEDIKRETRRYAKRQLTWFRRDPRIHWFDPDEYDIYEQLLIEILSIVGRTIKTNVE